MIPARLFRRYYFAATMIILTFIVLGYITARLLTHFTATPNEAHHPVFYAKLLDHLSPGHREQALAQFNGWNTGGPPYRFAIIDSDGRVLYPVGDRLPEEWESIQKPADEYGYVPVKDPQAGPRSERALIRFSGEPPQYLYVALDHGRGRSPVVFASTFISLIISVLLGIAVSMILLFRSLREKAILADSVLAQLQSGNLKARFPIRRMDEFGAAMSRFNRMADEIERLVERLKSVEKSRMALLQELAHDLRTPVASLKNMLETMLTRSATMDPAIREELLTLSVREAEYFERLVEDLLMLAQVTEPRYRISGERVAIDHLLEDEAESVAAHAATERGQRVDLQLSIAPGLPAVEGDPHLLRRMIRNVLDNAFSFARARVFVELREAEPGLLRLEIRDDGQGFSEEALATFGERRTSRFLGYRKTERLSVGLGSVILRTVAELHRGRVEARNVTEGSAVLGASVTIILPTSNAPE